MAAPSAPVINEQPLAEDTQLSFQWEPQASVDDFYIYDNDGISTLLTSVPGNITVTTVTGLTNGQTYNAFISGSNVNGMGPPSFFRPFEPGLPPTIAPLNVSVVKGNSNCMIEWTATGESLAAPIRWYAIETNSTAPNTSNLRFTADGFNGQTSYLVDNLASNQSYQFTVQGVNCPGYSPVAYTSTVNFMEMGSWYTDQGTTVLATPEFLFRPALSSFTFECLLNFSILFGTGGFDFFYAFSDSTEGGSEPYNLSIKFYQLTAAFSQIAIGPQAINCPLLTTNQWYHLAISRDITQSTVAVWINGNREGSNTDYYNYSGNSSSNPFVFDNTGTSQGYITNLNFINGVAKYNPSATTIPVPQSPFTTTVDTYALYLAKNSASSFYDETGIHSTLFINPIGISWSSTTPFA